MDVADPSAVPPGSRISPSVGVNLELSPYLQRRVVLRLKASFPNAWRDGSFSWAQVNERREERLPTLTPQLREFILEVLNLVLLQRF